MKKENLNLILKNSKRNDDFIIGKGDRKLKRLLKDEDFKYDFFDFLIDKIKDENNLVLRNIDICDVVSIKIENGNMEVVAYYTIYDPVQYTGVEVKGDIFVFCSDKMMKNVNDYINNQN